MAQKRIGESRIFFPWESHGGVSRWVGLGRLRPILVFVVSLAAVVLIAARERRQSETRQTRAALRETERAVQAFMAEHDGGCPTGPQDIASHMKHQSLRLDAWGQPPRVICPSREVGIGFDVVSDGPDKIPGGLDRIE
jgi:hypothetical protein